MSIHTFTHNDSDFLLDGKPILLRSGELHYSRIPREYWRDRLLKARALGLNAICIYMFWNAHEPTPGNFHFSGDQDVVTFIKTAQDVGLWVIVRPGPYCCAEWDFGGLPWWLLKHNDLRLRCLDDSYWPYAKRYLERVGQELKDLTISRGGPILMVQVENEYGSYGNDRPYLEEIRKTLRESGFDTLLFTSDASDSASLAAGTLKDCLAVANFGSKAELHMTNLRKWQPKGPLMNGEFWCGWFDEFGKPRNGSDSIECIKDVEWMLDNNVSFNVYMLHGGTNFGYTAGANQYDYHAPYVSSYDYWAFIDEAGRLTPKYHAARKAIAKRLKGETVPEPPAPMKIIDIPQFDLSESAAVFENLPSPVHVSQPRSMEQFDQPHGYILYRTKIEGLGGGKLKFDAHDFAIVYVNGKRIGTTWRTQHQDTVEIPAMEGRVQIDILVAALGRTNYGPKMIDRKGIPDRVQLGLRTLMHWEVYKLPFDRPQQKRFNFGKADQNGPALHRGKFNLSEVGDTFLDLRDWNFGTVWVNGHHLGRFWRIGPQQTLYLPGCWLRRGENEVVVLALESSGRKPLRGLREPVLNEVRELE